MKTQERFLNILDGVLLALAMAWTVTFAATLIHRNINNTALESRAAITHESGSL